MRVVWGEFWKVAARRSFLLAFAFFLGANAVLVVTDDRGLFYGKEDYKEVYASMENLSQEEKIAYIEENYHALMERQNEGADTDSYAKYLLFESLYQEISDIGNYPEYVAETIKEAKGENAVSIFRKQDSFSVRNAKKTGEAFAGLAHIRPQLQNSAMVNQMTDFSSADIFLVLLLFLSCSFLIIEEKEEGLFSLLKPLKYGRARLMAGKVFALLAVTAVVNAVFLLENYLISGIQYGFARMDLPIQSVQGYMGCALPVDLRGYLCLFFASKTAALFMLGLFFLLFALAAGSAMGFYLESIAFLGIAGVFYALIPGNSPFSLLKYVNIIRFLQVTPIYRYYFNLNLAGYAAGMAEVFWASVFICAVALPVLLCVSYSGKEFLQAAKKRSVGIFTAGGCFHTGVFGHECYKALIMNRVFGILLIFAVVQICSVAGKNTYLSVDEYYYRQYMQALENMPFDEGIALMEKEQKRFQEWDTMAEEARQKFAAGSLAERELQKTEELIAEETKGRNAFESVLWRRDYLTEYEDRTGKQPGFVYEGGWNYLFGKEYVPYQNDMLRSGALLVFMVAAFAGIFGTDFSTQMIRLMVCSRLGRMHTVRMKLWVCRGMLLLFFITAYLPDWIDAYRIYGLGRWGASIYSIPQLSGFPFEIPIGAYVLLLFLERYLMASCVLWMILASSVYTKNTAGAAVILLFLLGAPLAADYLGLYAVRNFSMNRFLTGNGYLDCLQVNGWYAVTIVFPAALAFACRIFLYRQFRE